MNNYGWGTNMDKFIENYGEMLEVIVQARIASDKVDEWKKSLEDILNPEPRSRHDYTYQVINSRIDYDKYI